ncbi:MAG: hypothetical protein COW24_01545 [Candidatus Kerfeldbacteria bacterium CG15_BIG_FIL_POST_REV_8_21_14_020_45_12]|uniref:Sodium:proton exchanger n=1 Tax=Candidatus Kerfeldbacteria bacterium CG15_BIG_FIL_POST_REV_8_21_14_020_45_12 TaxID=2014247 RepID=A0A2M7H4H2_9BACT|nr:MAG: hypothetical protein COW24_01545 [Candidatus Kerfeldbacteria bacterium CG15_BIG_FIL_POST_REV_8_21_14_020_45_12]PJA94089.1 MAG: hypothetical protein CO132_00125 [Candidatus Kerfeldbacteria bacterium CG_4_9_14_3_um_filter_45_8]
MDAIFFESIFFEVSAVLVVGTVFAAVAVFMRQPTIPAYILAGVVIGPAVLNILHNADLLNALAEFGIAFLLFLVGIELDLRKLMKTGRVSIVLGFVQMGFSVGFGYVLIRMLGFHSSEAAFLALALGFSSTIVAVKILGERKEIHTMYAQIVIGLLLTQDFIAILLLILLNVFGGSGIESSLGTAIGVAFVKGAVIVLAAIIASRYVLGPLFKYFARSDELLFLGSICWCLIFAATAHVLGFSIELGAIAAGLSLSFQPYSVAIGNRIKSLRDFFLPFFFAVLGGQLVFSGTESVFMPTLVLSTLVLVIMPVIVIGALMYFGYRARTSFQAGMAIGQVSEFSFIVMSLGFSAGIISRDIVALVALIGLVTMTLSSYMMKYSEHLYVYIRPILKRFERSTVRLQDDTEGERLKGHAIIFGYSTMGSKVQQLFVRMGLPTLVVDNNPDVIDQLQRKKIPELYGNLNDTDILAEANISQAKYVVTTVPSTNVVRGLLEWVQKNNLTCTVIVTAFEIDDALRFYEMGADFVLYPTFISADYLDDLLTSKQLVRKRKRHIGEMKKLKELTI